MTDAPLPEPVAWHIRALGWGEELRFTEEGAKELVGYLTSVVEISEARLMPLFTRDQLLSALSAERQAREAAEKSRHLLSEQAHDNAVIIADLKERLEAAEAVITPFAAEATYWRDIPGVISTSPNVELWQNPGHRTKLTVGHLRAAAEFMKGAK